MQKLIAQLAKAEFPFVVVGGYAAYAHGATIVTQDIDVCCEFSEESLQKLQEALADLHPVHRMYPERLPFEVRPGMSASLETLYLDTDAGQLDLLGHVKGIGDYQDAWQNSIEVIIDEYPIRVLSLPAIIRAKEAMNRDRDKEAVRQLKFIQEQEGEAK